MIPEEVLRETARPQAEADTETVEIYELGRGPDGEVIKSNRRLFMQLYAFGDCSDTQPLIDALRCSRSAGNALRRHQRPTRRWRC